MQNEFWAEASLFAYHSTIVDGRDAIEGCRKRREMMEFGGERNREAHSPIEKVRWLRIHFACRGKDGRGVGRGKIWTAGRDNALYRERG
jgi:hypothetical protein